MRMAVIRRARGYEDTCLKQGWWSYSVPEFTFQRFPSKDGFVLDRAKLARDFDVIFHEDWVWAGSQTGGRIPVAYAVVDSNTSERRFRRYTDYARRFADVALLDQDNLGRWSHVGPHVYRWAYAVNERVFRPLEKTVDVAYHASLKGCRERVELSDWLERFCEERGYRYCCGRRVGTEYPLAFNRAKVVVDLGRTPETRNHRAFDVMASMACLVTSPLPDVAWEDHGTAGIHHLEWRDFDELGRQIEFALTLDNWWLIADCAYELAQERHTWRVRARELRAIVEEIWPGIGKGKVA